MHSSAVNEQCCTCRVLGFNQIPLCVLHRPLLYFQEAGYVTEVHHVNSEGEDAGVVYCEMQGRENTGFSRVHLALLRAMYPGRCGYKSETGGIMSNLRDSTSHEKVWELIWSRDKAVKRAVLVVQRLGFA